MAVWLGYRECCRRSNEKIDSGCCFDDEMENEGGFHQRLHFDQVKTSGSKVLCYGHCFNRVQVPQVMLEYDVITERHVLSRGLGRVYLPSRGSVKKHAASQ